MEDKDLFKVKEHFNCPDCGVHIKADEDGCCVHCGQDCVIEDCNCLDTLKENKCADFKLPSYFYISKTVEELAERICSGDFAIEAQKLGVSPSVLAATLIRALPCDLM